MFQQQTCWTFRSRPVSYHGERDLTMNDTAADNVQGALTRLADQITEAFAAERNLALIGIRSRGDILSRRLSKALAEKGLRPSNHGVLDITLYRDDLDQVGGQARVRATEIDFDITDCLIVLVDDVIFTGRTVRAALDALIDLGRPRAIRLAVLVDRGGRELPIQPDFVGLKLPSAEAHVQVLLKETDGQDRIILRD